MFIVFSFTENAGGLRRRNREVYSRTMKPTSKWKLPMNMHPYRCCCQKQREQPEKDLDCKQCRFVHCCQTNNRLVANLEHVCETSQWIDTLCDMGITIQCWGEVDTSHEAKDFTTVGLKVCETLGHRSLQSHISIMHRIWKIYTRMMNKASAEPSAHKHALGSEGGFYPTFRACK